MRYVAVVVALVGCAADHGGTSTEVVGDWWECEAPDCSTFKDTGAHYQSDGVYARLRVTPLGTPFSATAQYCTSTSQADSGTYTFDAAMDHVQLTDQLGRDAGGATIVFQGAIMDVTPDNGGHTQFERISPSRLDGACSF